MHFSSPKMVCETKIVADEHDAIPGTKKESIMWSAPPSPPPPAPAAPSSAALNAAEPKDARKDARKDAVFIREFECGDQREVRRIFYEGIMERIPNTAFRGLRQQPKTQFLYALLTGKCPALLRFHRSYSSFLGGCISSSPYTYATYRTFIHIYLFLFFTVHPLKSGVRSETSVTSYQVCDVLVDLPGRDAGMLPTCNKRHGGAHGCTCIPGGGLLDVMTCRCRE